MRYYISIEARNYLNNFFEILQHMEKKMFEPRPTDNLTVYFIKCMIPHHQAAIYMCENLLEHTRYEPLENIARNIIEVQTHGIEQMEEISRTTANFKNSKEDIDKYIMKYLSITKNMIYRMSNSLRSNNINLDFISEMIPHHEGAIQMCQNLLEYCIDPRLKAVAKSIILEQSRGVEQLKELKNKLK